MASRSGSNTSVFAAQRSIGAMGSIRSLSEVKSLSSIKSQAQSEERLPAELDINTIIYKYNLNDYRNYTEEERERRLAQLDSLDLLKTVEMVQNDLALIKLENYILIDFLEKNDPKLLIGIKQRRGSNVRRLQSRQQRSSVQSTGARSILSMHSVMSYSLHNEQRKKVQEYKLNYKAKAEMAEKCAAEVEWRVVDIQKSALHEIKDLRAQIEELHFRSEETNETEKNFNLHFLGDANDLAFLETATEKQMERKLRKFTTNWFKNARALLSTMRLTITSLQESCQQHRSDLITKADLSGILTAVDFEKLIIKRTQLFNELEEKNVHMAGLKGVTGKASLAMTEEKQKMQNLENDMKNVLNKTEEVNRAIIKLKKEITIVEDNNKKDRTILAQLRQQLQEYEAPSVSDYIEKKEEAALLEKEEKMLQRKIYILNMKLNNILKKTKKQ